jgi:uncharacterized protein YbjT (DUF2867 family)
MSTILVTGGTGALGRPVVDGLRAHGHDVRVLSRRPGAGTHVGDLTTGAGVAEAVRGAERIVHAASDVRRAGAADLEQTAHLVEAAGDVSHLLYVSIVGIDRIPYRYYRRKLACEHRIQSSGVACTILRATQFHELLGFVLRGAERLPLAPLPLDFRFQTIAAAEVAERVVELIGGEPAGRLELGGPEVLTLGQMAEAWRLVRHRPRRIVPLPLPGKVARGFRQGLNTRPDKASGRQTWAEFVASNPVIPYTVKDKPGGQSR